MGEALAEITLMIQDEKLGSTLSLICETKKLSLPDDSVDRFLDGPACRRVGIVDFDPATGAPLAAPAPFVPYKASNPARGRYVTKDLPHDSPQFLAVNAFGTVLETIEMFEERAALGRQVEWAFPGEQLLVVPRAGEWANAFYERATRSLQFFWFDSASSGRIYTALSRDIVAHECGHALLDAVVPSLHDALTPESIAIHEAIADLVAVLMALRSRPLRSAVLKKFDNSISDACSFSSIAEQFGAARPTADDLHPAALRDLRNTSKISDVDRRKPHQLSTILSAIFYESLIDVFESLKQTGVSPPPGVKPLTIDQAAGRALGSAEIVCRRLLLRAIDYLPPGELTFADVARAALAADGAADLDDEVSPDKKRGRESFAQRFVDREVVASIDELFSDPPELMVDKADLVDIRDSDWTAYRFVDRHREVFGIPDDVPFTVMPRIDATKEIGRKDPTTNRYLLQRELLIKVAWDVVEPNQVQGVPARSRRIRTGVVVAIRWDDARPLALVKSDVMIDAQRATRDAMLTQLLDDDMLSVVTGEVPPGSSAHAEAHVRGDVATFSGTQRLLHLAGAPT